LRRRPARSEVERDQKIMPFKMKPAPHFFVFRLRLLTEANISRVPHLLDSSSDIQGSGVARQRKPAFVPMANHLAVVSPEGRIF
jgi:hypothetical protein